MDTAFIQKLTDKVEAINVNSVRAPEQLAEVVSQLNDEISPISAAITAEIAKLNPYLALLSLPSPDPASIVSWLGNLLTATVAPQIAAATRLAVDAAALTVAVGSLTAAISAKASEIGSVTVELPDLPSIPELPDWP